MRNQAGIAATISGLVATVFASLVDSARVFRVDQDTFLLLPLDLWLVLMTFVPSIYCAAMVGVTWRTCTFELSPKFILDEHTKGTTESDIKKKLALDADRYFDENEEVISEAQSYLWWASVLACSQIPAWLILIT